MLHNKAVRNLITNTNYTNYKLQTEIFLNP